LVYENVRMIVKLPTKCTWGDITAANSSQSFTNTKTSWHKYGSKLRHCRPVYVRLRLSRMATRSSAFAIGRRVDLGVYLLFVDVVRRLDARKCAMRRLIDALPGDASSISQPAVISLLHVLLSATHANDVRTSLAHNAHLFPFPASLI